MSVEFTAGERYLRVPMSVRAIQVSESNMRVIAEQTDGEVLTYSHGERAGTNFISFFKLIPFTQGIKRKRKADIGDWVVVCGTSVRVWTDGAFTRSFVPEQVLIEDPKQYFELTITE